MTVGCTSAAALVHGLGKARHGRRHLNLQRQLARLSLLIIDELGLVPLSRTGEVFSQRHGRGSLLVTSNLSSDEWTGCPGSSVENGLPARCWTGSPITSTSWKGQVDRISVAFLGEATGRHSLLSLIRCSCRPTLAESVYLRKFTTMMASGPGGDV